jgi:hypothetical protein
LSFSGDFLVKAADASPLLRLFNDDVSAGEALWNSMSESERGKVTGVLNFYELVASEYNAGWLDEEVADKHLAYMTVAMWKLARGLAEWLRRADARYYEQWKYLFDTKRTTIEAASGLPAEPAASPSDQ